MSPSSLIPKPQVLLFVERRNSRSVTAVSSPSPSTLNRKKPWRNDCTCLPFVSAARVVVPLHGVVPVVEAVAKIAHLAVRIAHAPAGDECFPQVGHVVAIHILQVNCFAPFLDQGAAPIEGN